MSSNNNLHVYQSSPAITKSSPTTTSLGCCEACCKKAVYFSMNQLELLQTSPEKKCKICNTLLAYGVFICVTPFHLYLLLSSLLKKLSVMFSTS